MEKISRIKVYYASGINYELYGQWMGLIEVSQGRGLYVPAVENVHDVVIQGVTMPSGSVSILDQRAVCVDQDTGDILYNPRQHWDDLDMDCFGDWWKDHPEWPAVLELEGL